MTIRRLLTSVIAMIAALGMTAALTAPPATAAGKKTRPLTASAGKVGHNKFQVHGKVGHYAKQRVLLRKGRGKNGPFHAFKSDRTDRNGKYRLTFRGPVGTCYQVVVPGNKTYKLRKETIGCIVRR